MVLYYQSGGEVYLLLADHAGNDRGWAGFGGGGREGETIDETAAHKAEEEFARIFQTRRSMAPLPLTSPRFRLCPRPG